MDFTISSDSLSSSTISHPSRSPVYELSTSKGKRTPILLTKRGVEIASIGKDPSQYTVLYGPREILLLQIQRVLQEVGELLPEVAGLSPDNSSTSTTFTFSNGKDYIWKRDRQNRNIPRLTNTSNPKKPEPIATFHYAFDSNPTPRAISTLSITNPDSSAHLLDKIIATFVFIEQQNRGSRLKKGGDN
ncbi:hypothetical protein V5O48_018056, partial [Marasmius crinis-equi]